MILRIFFSLVALPLFATSCNMTFEVGLEENPTQVVSSTATAPAQNGTWTPTAFEEPPINTITPTTLPTSSSVPTREAPTNTPSPTPLPGLEVIPLASMGKDIPWLPVDKARWPAVHVVTFNTQLPPFDNPLVRQAFAASVDKGVIVEMAEQYYAIDPAPATTFIPPQTLGRNLYGAVGIKFDPTKARELLTQAGYPDTSSFPAVTFIVNSYGDTAPGARFNIANAMAEMWRTYLGVNVEVEAFEPATFRDRITTNPPELFWVGWLPDPGNDPDFIRLTYHTDAIYNYGHFSNSTFDSLVDRAATIHDPAMRQELYIEAERVLCETEAGIMPLYYTFTKIP
ncbi:MAG TPA: ABC transporter substrate-binding protein [Anaerolineales bacterium]|nr:ABC transporter substrate-binding protein [Anaerolineales bacterium]